jgi:hypothetical protein
MLEMLQRSQALKVMDLRDQVQATLNLVVNCDDDGEELDYEQSLAKRYLRVARVLLYACNSLYLLAIAKIPTIPDRTVQGLPL